MFTTQSLLAFDSLKWEQVLAEAARRYHVPGIVAGVLQLDQRGGAPRRFVASTGVANARTGVESTRDTLCQIGSITKVVTATMIMQLREEGKLRLDTPVTEILTDLELADIDASTITIEHLLTHTSGIDGDVFEDTGRGDDCLEKYAGFLKDTRSLFAPGSGWSYCNSGWVVLGRVIEVLDGGTWDASLRARISDRLELDQFLTLPEEILSYRSQHGHVRDPGQKEWHLAPVSSIPRSMGPAGLITSSVDNLLDFGAAFLLEGQGKTGTPILSADSIALMTQTHVELDTAAASAAPRWGLGWMLDDWNGHPVYWHGGTTIGNKAWLKVLPEDGLVLVVFCNGGIAEAAGSEILTVLAREFADTHPGGSARPSGPANAAVIDDHLLGTYADFNLSVQLTRDEDGAIWATMARLLETDGQSTEPMQLFPAEGKNRFVTRADGLAGWTQLNFTTVDGQECLYADIRCLRRSDTTDQANANVNEVGAQS